MESPKLQDLEESIKELNEYKNRLKEELTSMAKNLRMPQSKIDLTFSNHQEIKQIDKLIEKLTRHKQNLEG